MADTHGTGGVIAPKAPRVAVYARTSTARDQSPDLQLDELRVLVEQRGWRVVGEHVDVGESGSKERRPALDELMSKVRRGQVDIVLVWRFDRFARSVRHLVMALDEFRERGVDFVSLRDGVDTSTLNGRLMFQIFAAFAEFERELLRERTRAGLAAARRRGQALGRPRMFVNVQRAIELKRCGLSVRAIAKALGMSSSTVHRALRKAGSLPQSSQQPDIIAAVASDAGGVPLDQKSRSG